MKKKKMEQFLKYVEESRDADGYAVVDVRLGDEVPLYDPRSIREKRDLSGDIYDYIEEQANIVPAQVPLKVRFHGDVPEEEQEEIRKIMRRHYTVKSYDVTWDVAANFRKMIGLTIFGMLVLAAYFYVTFAMENVMFAEILSIVGSFSLWEAADALLLERPRLKREYRNVEQNINQVVEFVNAESKSDRVTP